DISFQLRWIELTVDGDIVLTARGMEISGLLAAKDRLREALVDHVNIVRPPWLQNAIFGRSRFLLYAPSEIAQVCREAGLVDDFSDETVAFWDRLSAIARGVRDLRRNEVGRLGERLAL